MSDKARTLAFIDKIKKNNFEYGSTKDYAQDHFRSTSNIVFDSKMTSPAFKKAVLDVEKKKDLTTNHFTIGGPSANITQTT